MNSPKRYAVVGVSNRAYSMFMDPILNVYNKVAELVAMVDSDCTRMNQFNYLRKLDIPSYSPDEFDEMVAKERPDVIIVACRDGFHHEYIIKALEHDLDVISEKPMTIDEEKCALIVRAQNKSKGQVKVTFNYRYGPTATKIRELVESGRIGRVVSVDLNWYLDTDHGSSYFQRWNRVREVSGGLSIHKACHHFDLVHWWIGQRAMDVHAFGALNFYGSGGVHNPLSRTQLGDGRTCVSCDSKQKCVYYMRWHRDEFRQGQAGKKVDEFAKARENYEGYSRRQCIYDPQVNIEDTYAAIVKYDGGAFLNYSLNASVPYEGYRLGINGTEGRIDYADFHGAALPFPDAGKQPVYLTPMFGGREQIDTVNLGGGHGGGDPLLLDELFIGPDPTASVKRQAGLEDGVEAVLTGVAVHRSANEQCTISIDQMRKRVFDV